MFDQNHLHIVLASDNNYAEFIAVVLVSLFVKNKEFSNITVHILSNVISQENQERLKTHIPKEKGEIYFYDISNLEKMLGIKVPDTIAVSAYARLFIPSILPADIDRILYVDCDTLICSSLKSLWTITINNNLIAGVIDPLPNHIPKIKIGIEEDTPYFNSGVLLINLKLWREENLQQQFLTFLYRHNGHVHHHDQGIINAVCDGRKRIIHPKFNVMSTFYSHKYSVMNSCNTPFYSEKDIVNAKMNPVIIHFTEDFYNRPWIKNSKHPCLSLYKKYHDMTAWRNAPLRKDHRSLIVRILSWEFLNLPLFFYKFTQKVIKWLKH